MLKNNTFNFYNNVILSTWTMRYSIFLLSLNDLKSDAKAQNFDENWILIIKVKNISTLLVITRTKNIRIYLTQSSRDNLKNLTTRILFYPPRNINYL
jgi:hypothetical protein